MAGWQHGKRGFSKEQGSRQAHFPTHLLAGSMVCGCCGATIAQASGRRGGYYGCLAATKGACDNNTLVRRTLAERVILEAVQDQISDPEHIAYVLHRVEQEIAKQRADLPDTLQLKEAELGTEQRTARSAQMLRDLLGPIKLELQTPDIGRPFYRAVTTLDAVALIDEPPPGAEGGSDTLRRWRRRELNPRPQSRKRWRLRA